MASTQHKAINLGPPPWTEEELERAVFLNHSAVQTALYAHTGREIHERLESLASILRLFNKTANAIQDGIQRFHSEVHENNLFQRSRRYDRQRLEEGIQEALYVFAASSMTLVDLSRALKDKINIPGYGEHVTQSFAKSPLHRFVQELRVDMIHVTLHEPSWQLTSGRNEEPTTYFLLHPRQLKRIDDYHPLARQYVSDHPKGIDLARTVSHYQGEVNSLHMWLCDAVETAAGDTLTDYRRSQRIVRAVSSRSLWRLILSQVVIEGNRDPYAYLDRYLTLDELRDVMSHQHRSKAQVDRIIELIDEDGACNAELREIVYKSFKVACP